MHISSIFEDHRPSLSVEFFPPGAPDAWDSLFDTIADLESLPIRFVSVTYGAGGSTRAKTHELVTRIQTETRFEPIPHLTCVCQSKVEVAEILTEYAKAGIDNIMALGGDPPKSRPEGCPESEFTHAIDLVRFIRGFEGRDFGIGVAGFPEGHPRTPNRIREMDYLKEKVDAGADYICTQLFFDVGDFLDFVERCRIAGIDVPILAGVMPLLSLRSVQRVPELALGSRYPAALQRLLAECRSDADVAAVGVDWAAEQCARLLEEDVAGIHLYTLNRIDATVELLRRIGVDAFEV
ncbi:MAG: methylenetetrahydrofolate reductase [NAD(P)H] [Spirochaetaceae bacterium]